MDDGLRVEKSEDDWWVVRNASGRAIWSAVTEADAEADLQTIRQQADSAHAEALAGTR